MKKKIVLVAIVIFLFVGLVVSVPLVNDFSAKNVEKSLVEIALPENTQMVESLSKAGKLVGNGNGMQYFGAMLIQSELTMEELSDYYSQKNADIIVKVQKTQKIECVEHAQLSFTTQITDAENYYIVYLFGEGIAPFAELDLRGH